MFKITGLGIICSLGPDLDTVRASLLSGRDGIAVVNRFDTSMFTAHYAAMIDQKHWTHIGATYPELDKRTALACFAAQQAIDNANVNISGNNRAALVYGICVGGKHGDDDSIGQELLRNRLQNQAASLSAVFGISGPSLVTSTACASSAHALGLASYLLRMDLVDIVLVGGAGDIAPEMYAGFHALGVMSPAPCAPFSVPAGLNLGEGAAFFVIQKTENYQDNSKNNWGFLSGYGSALDAYHATTPDPSGSGVARALGRAIQDAKIKPEEILYVNLHGTGTLENDKSEWLGVKTQLKDHSNVIPISSSKSFLGHTGGAAGMVEAAVTLITMKEQVIPPTMHCTKKRRLSPPDIVAETKPRHQDYSIAASLNAAFGGANTAVILSDKILSNYEKVDFKPVAICGAGVVLPGSVQSLVWNETLEGNVVQTIIEDLSEYTKNRDDRYLDPVSRFLSAATYRALHDANKSVNEELAVKRGLYVGAAHVPSYSIDEFETSQNVRGLENISPHAFARIVMNAATGAAAELVRLKGPSMTIASGDGAGLIALISACIELTINSDLELCIAAGADELGKIPKRLHALAERNCIAVESAAACVLSRQDFKNTDIYISGVGLAGPQFLESAIMQALSIRPGSIDYIFDASDQSPKSKIMIKNCLESVSCKIGKPLVVHVARHWGFAEATTSLVAVVSAFKVLTENSNVSRVMVITSSAMNCSSAVLIERICD